MSETPTATVRPARSWREISQDVKPRAMSRKGRRRQYTAWAKITVVITLAVLLAGGLLNLAHEWTTDREAFAETVDSQPVREISVITNGTLPKPWVTDALALPKGASLMALDLPALRDRLLARGQVRVAVVTRQFPDMLVVTLQERSPVARIQAVDGSGQPKQLFVAKDGVVYDGVNYDRQLVNSLPWLDGVRLVRTKAGFAPIEGMADVALLLTTAQIETPQYYRNWMIVSLARMAARDEIVVKSQDAAEIVFSRKLDFYRQVAQLDYILEMSRQLPPEAGLRNINLALATQIPVKFEKNPDELSRMENPSVHAPQFTLQPLPRKGSRDI